MSGDFNYFLTICLLSSCFIGATYSQRKVNRNAATGSEGKQVVDFDCPEEFGYYPHPTDCTQYYVCVFGGALLESCTGGLMYSHELQTCDWPRNVGCDAAGTSAVHQSSPDHTPSRQSQSNSGRYVQTQQQSSSLQSRGQTRQPQFPTQQQQLPTLRQEEDYQYKKQKQHQQQLYAVAESDLPPVEEIESDRQQRVYRGQPSTVGQVQRDRDALRHTNAIPVQNIRNSKIGVISFGTQQQQAPQQSHIEQPQYRIEPSTLAPEQYAPAPRPVSITTAGNTGNTGRALYNTSAAQNYDQNQYDPYYALYDDDVELYRDVADYGHNYNTAPISEAPKQVYRGTPATQPQPVESATVSSRAPAQYIQQDTVPYNVHPQQTLYKQQVSSINDDYSDVSYEVDANQYQSADRNPGRGDRNDLRFPEPTTKKAVKTTSTTTTTTTTTSTTTTTRRPSTVSSIRTNVRGRGSAHYTSAGEEVPVNRGTPPTRSRPTLKPSTSIVSKASEFIDIYKYPPTRPSSVYPTPQVDKSAAKCRKDVCLLPDCSCGGKDIPGDLPVESVPQIVLLTFDDSVNDLNKGLYSDLFEKGRVNPNGCPISATFYVSHEWTDYSQVQNLYATGHEIASHTVSHSFGEQFSQKKWNREVAGQREILAAYGGVHLEDVRGMRAPFLSVGGNKMFKMLYDSNFTYDSSMPVYENRPPSWPYTLDYKLFHDCMIPPCPTRSYPGVWEVPMVMWQDLNGGRCSMGDACSNPPASDGVFKMLMKNFDRHYSTNRAPFGLFYHAAWFTQPHHKEGFIQFLDTINAMKDVYLVTNWQAIQWVRDPTPLSRIGNFQPFQCNYANRPKKCNNPKVCNLWHKSGVRYMRTCQPCPDIYPWTGKTGIKSSRIDNDIED